MIFDPLTQTAKETDEKARIMNAQEPDIEGSEGETQRGPTKIQEIEISSDLIEEIITGMIERGYVVNSTDENTDCPTNDNAEMKIAGIEFKGVRTFFIAILLIVLCFVGSMSTGGEVYTRILELVAIAYFAYKAGDKSAN
jgi:hypothetical protein